MFKNECTCRILKYSVRGSVNTVPGGQLIQRRGSINPKIQCQGVSEYSARGSINPRIQ